MLVPHASPSARGHNRYGGFVVAIGFTQQKRRTCSIQPIPPITSRNVVCVRTAKNDPPVQELRLRIALTLLYWH